MSFINPEQRKLTQISIPDGVSRQSLPLEMSTESFEGDKGREMNGMSTYSGTPISLTTLIREASPATDEEVGEPSSKGYP